MASRTILHQSWDIFGTLTSATEYLLPCVRAELPAEVECPAWILQFIDQDESQLADVWNRYLDSARDEGLRELVSLLRELRPDGLLPWQGRYWVHFGLPEAQSPDVLKSGEEFFDHYWSDRPGFYLPSPVNNLDVVQLMASVGLPPDPTTIEFLQRFSGLREEPPWDAGQFIDATADWVQLKKDYTEVSLVCDGVQDWNDAFPLFFAANSTLGVMSPSGAIAWYVLQEHKIEYFAPSFAQFVNAMVRVKRRGLEERFDYYSEPG